jgi:ADP-ribosyl-[dinitrogen reductase] hydrolase
MCHTVPVAVHAWLAHPEDFRAAVLAAVRCGGDTDTLAAIVGGIVGARVGRAGIPAEWLSGLWEWPRSVAWMERLGGRLAEVSASGTPQRALPLAVWAVPLRNQLFVAVVLTHGFRRPLPPY